MLIALKNSYNIILIRCLYTFILLFTSVNAFSQLFSGSQNPPGVKFSQINSPQFQIIYPTPLTKEAQRMANVLDSLVTCVSKSLGHLPQPISIILQTQGVVANGFVQMAPRRSEFYTIPSQEFDTQDWLNSLAVHELRHVVQFDKLAPKLKAPFFEELKMALFGVNLPAWFFEGDAVGIETILTQSGRGRQPIFEMTLRSNELSGNHFSYSKNYLGSYKSLTPGYYSLGYFMTTKIRRDFGPLILDRTLERIKRFPIRPYNFSSSLKKYTGIGTKELYRQTIKEIDSLWANQLQKINPINYQPENKIQKEPASYLFPYATADGGIVCLKNTLSETPTIVYLKNKSEKKLIRIGSQTEPNLNYATNKLVWDEYRADYRFQQRSYNVICTFDIETKKFKQLTQKSRLFSPSLSPDGKRIIAVKVSTENIFNLVEIDGSTGEELISYPNPANFTLQTPSFDHNGKQIVVTAVNNLGKTLLLYSCEDLSFKQLLPQERQLISRPIFFEQDIIYKAHYNGIDNIYGLDLLTKKIHQITKANYGAFNPSVDKDKGLLFFNDYHSNGQHIASLNISSYKATFDTSYTNTFVNYFEPLKAQENTSDIFNSTAKNHYPSKPYKEANQLFYFHSLRLISESNTNFSNEYNTGFNILSDNKLNTLSTTLGYRFNNALNKNEYKATFVYQKFYPQIALNYENRVRLSYKEISNGQSVPFQWRENYTSISVKLPYFTNWLNKNFNAYFKSETYFINRYQLNLRPTGFISNLRFPFNHQFFIGLNSQTSKRDLAPKWGQNLDINFDHTPFEQRIVGTNFTLKTAFYFPGLFKNHSLQVSLNTQNNSGAFRFNTDIPRANGYAYFTSANHLKNTFLLDYRFPIFYPDLELGPIAYIKRIKGGFFTDFENLNEGGGMKSFGAELRADLNLLRYYLPNFDLGGKIIILNQNNTKKPIFEFSLNFSY
jgi:hypothetical protein